ncbi:MAG: DUF4367 domain-containing protein [Clostridia bacterium]
MRNDFEKNVANAISDQIDEELVQIEDELKNLGYDEDFFKMKSKTDKQIRHHINQANKNTVHRHWSIARIAASIILVIVIGFSVPYITVEAFRTTFNEFIVNVFDTYSVVIFENDDTQDEVTYIDENSVYVPSYVPDGYVEVENNVDEFVNFVVYENELGYKIHFSQQIINEVGNFIDTENRIIENIDTIFGEMMYAQKTERMDAFVTFTYDGYVFYIDVDNLSKDELVKVAESITNEVVENAQNE